MGSPFDLISLDDYSQYYVVCTSCYLCNQKYHTLLMFVCDCYHVVICDNCFGDPDNRYFRCSYCFAPAKYNQQFQESFLLVGQIKCFGCKKILPLQTYTDHIITNCSQKYQAKKGYDEYQAKIKLAAASS